MKKSIKQQFSDMKIRNKLTVVCCIILLVSMVSLAIITHALSSYFVTNISMNYSAQIINQLNSNIEDRFALMDALASQVLLNNDIFDYLCTAENIIYDSRVTLDRYYAIQSYLASLCAQNESVTAITLYCLGSAEVIVTDKQTNWPSHKIPEQEHWFRLLLDSDLYFTTLVKYDTESNQPTQCSVARKVIDRKTKSVIGIVVVDSSVSAIEQLLNNYDFGSDSVVVIRDQYGDEVYSSNPGSYLSDVDISEKSKVVSICDEKILVSSNVSKMSGWTVSCLIPLNYITRDIQLIYPAFFIVALLNFSFAILAIYFVAKTITKPLEVLVAKMNEIAKGNWNIDPPKAVYDEVGIVTKSFYDMANQIQELIQSTYIMQIEKKDAEIKMFQLQMEPHFIYNAMETIRIKAMLNEDYEVSTAITALGKFLRLKLNTATQCITVSEELEHVIGYYRLTVMCQQTSAQLVVKVEKEVYQKQIIKLSLQPLVENAIKHAFTSTSSNPTIWVEGKQEGKAIFFCVRDNGIGLQKEKLYQIQSGLLQNSDENHIGLKNVDHRLKLIYGQSHGLKIESVNGQGTSVSFRIPEVEMEIEAK